MFVEALFVTAPTSSSLMTSSLEQVNHLGHIPTIGYHRIMKIDQLYLHLYAKA